jgi:hypothetical protein
MPSVKDGRGADAVSIAVIASGLQPGSATGFAVNRGHYAQKMRTSVGWRGSWLFFRCI